MEHNNKLPYVKVVLVNIEFKILTRATFFMTILFMFMLNLDNN